MTKRSAKKTERKVAKQKQKKKKIALKQKKKLLKSNKSICNGCGFIGKPKKTKKGGWILFFIKLAFVVPTVLLIILLSFFEGLARGISLQKPHSILWNIGFENFFPYFPYVLCACPRCKSGNSMKKLKSQDGRFIFGRYEMDPLLKKRRIW